MNPHPAPSVLGVTEAARLDAAVRKMLSVSMEDFLKEEAKYQKAQAKKSVRRNRPLKAPQNRTWHVTTSVSAFSLFCRVSYCPK
jgi:hypothetical protein